MQQYHVADLSACDSTHVWLAGTGVDISGPSSVLQAVGVLAAVVTIHEAGHFTAARIQGIHVTKFAIGFGPALFKYQVIAEALKPIPAHRTNHPPIRPIVRPPAGLRDVRPSICSSIHSSRHLSTRHQSLLLARLSQLKADSCPSPLQGPEVEYSLRAIPLGGYVGFPDDDPDSPYPKDDPDLLRNKNLPARALVISAGILANIVSAYAILLFQVRCTL